MEKVFCVKDEVGLNALRLKASSLRNKKMIDYDKIAAEYAVHRKVNPEVLKSIISMSKIVNNSKVLEVGCGTGNYIVAIEALTGCSCWGIDLSKNMLSKAKKRSKTINFKLGNAEEPNFPSNFFDLIFSADVIHYINNRHAYFKEAFRVLKEGGKVCTITDSEWIIKHREPLTVYFPETVKVDLERYPNIAELREIMKEVSFKGIAEKIVEFPYRITDIQAYHDKAFSSLHIITEEEFRKGIEYMEKDLGSEPIKCVSRYLLLWGTK